MRKTFIKLIKIAQIPAFIVAVLMIINGVIDTSLSLLYIFNWDGITVEPVIRTNTLLSIFFGGILIFLGISLYQRKHFAWLASIVVLSAQFINNTFFEFKIELSVLSFISLVILIFSRKLFYVQTRKLSYSQIVACLAIIFALTYGIVGTYLMRDQFQNINTLVDAIYYTIVSFSTVGYGDMVPLTQNAKFFVTTMIIFGLGAFAIAISALVVPLLEREIKGVFYMMSRISHLHEHVIICGFNEIAIQTIQRINQNKDKYVVIEEKPDKAKMAEEQGFHVLVGKSDSIRTLQKANIASAKIVICLEDHDADNILIGITLKNYFASKKRNNPKIIAKIENFENIPKAKTIGIDEVFSPIVLSSQFINHTLYS